MNTRSSSYTGRAARSLEDAWGPYARGQVYEEEQPKPLGHKVAEYLGAIILVVMVGLVALGVV